VPCRFASLLGKPMRRRAARAAHCGRACGAVPRVCLRPRT
jgi:hypothetical protein